jgi:hypothetical protein
LPLAAPTSKSCGTTMNFTGRAQPSTSLAASWIGCLKFLPIHSLMKSLGPRSPAHRA